jgi:hypothetical protein
VQKTRNDIAKVPTPGPTIEKDRAFLLASQAVHARKKVKKKDRRSDHDLSHLDDSPEASE